MIVDISFAIEFWFQAQVQVFSWTALDQDDTNSFVYM